MKLPVWFHRFGSPPWVYGFAGACAPWLLIGGLLAIAVGAYWGLVIAPPDFRQGEVYRIIYIHPQSAYVGMMAYTLMAVAAGVGFIWRIKLAHAVAVSAAPIGAIPACGGLIAGLWGLYAVMIGLSKTQEISTGKAAAAVLIPIVICCVLGAILGALFGMAALFGAAALGRS